MTRKAVTQVDLNLLKVFSAIYRERNLTRAGESMFLSQSAVSHALGRLRLLFDDPLFVRTPEGMTPTNLADRLADPIRQTMQSAYDALRMSEHFDPEIADIEFGLGVTTIQSPEHLAAMYRAFEDQAPISRLFIRTISPTDLTADLRRGDIDVLLAVAGGGYERFLRKNSGYEVTDLFEDPIVCVVSASNDEVGQTMDIETYVRLPHLVVASERVTQTWIDTKLAEKGLRRTIAAVVPHPHAIPILSGASRLVATVAKSQVAAAAAQGLVRVLDAPIMGEPHLMRMIWHERTSHDPALIWFRHLVRQSYLENSMRR